MQKYIAFMSKDQVILMTYKNDDEIVELEKGIPKDLPYVKITSIDLPELQFSDAWELDLSNPDGYGTGELLNVNPN